MKEDSFWTIIKADILRYTGSRKFSIWSTIKAFYYEEGLIIIILFRLIQKISSLNKVFIILILPLKLILKILSILLGIRIDIKAKIGKGLYIGHYGGIFIGNVEMGKYCNISHQVTIGFSGNIPDRYGVPTIGEYVYLAPGAKLFSKIRIGNNVDIGANAVVSKDIPDNAIVVGNPGRIIGYKKINNIYEQFIYYEHFDLPPN